MTRVVLIRVLIVAAIVLALELLCRTGLVGRLTLIPPSEMVIALIEAIRTEEWFWPDVLYTLRNLFVAIVISIVGGFFVGVTIHSLPRLRRMLDPLLSSYYSVPTFVLYPLLIVFFGIGPLSLIAMGALFGIVAMISSTISAIDRIPSVLLRVARVSHLDPLRTTLLLKLPAAAPHLFTGLKLAVAYSVIGIIAGEFIVATAGIGRRLAFAYNDFDNRTMYAVLLLILVFVGTLNGLLGMWERRIHARWYRQ